MFCIQKCNFIKICIEDNERQKRREKQRTQKKQSKVKAKYQLLQSLREQNILEKQLFQTRELKERLKLNLSNFLTLKKENLQHVQQCQSNLIEINMRIIQLQQKNSSILENHNPLTEQIQYLQTTINKYTFLLNMIKSKYLLFNNQIVLDEVDQTSKKCKFYPNTQENNYHKFIFQQYQQGYLMKKISNDIGFTKITNQIAFPSEGQFHHQFLIKNLGSRGLLAGLMSKSSPNQQWEPFNAFYFNFRDKSIQYNNTQIQQFNCELTAGSRIQIGIDMTHKRITCNIDQNISKSLSFAELQLAKQSLYMFLAVNDGETVIFFSNWEQ